MEKGFADNIDSKILFQKYYLEFFDRTKQNYSVTILDEYFSSFRQNQNHIQRNFSLYSQDCFESIKIHIYRALEILFYLD